MGTRAPPGSEDLPSAFHVLTAFQLNAFDHNLRFEPRWAIRCMSMGIERVPKMKKQTTIGIDEKLIPVIKAEGEKIGLGWTSMVEVLVREALAARQIKAS